MVETCSGSPRNQHSDEAATVAVLGDGPVASVLAAAVGSCERSQSVAGLETAPCASTWIAVMRPYEAPGERCWWPMAVVALGAARLAALAQNAGSAPRVLLVVEGADSQERSSTERPCPPGLELARQAGQVALPPWAAEEPARELMALETTGAPQGSWDGQQVTRAVALAEALLPGSVSGVPRAGRPQRWSDVVATVLSQAGVVVEQPTLERLVRPLADPLGPAGAEPVPVVLPPRPVRPGLVARRQQAALWSGEVKFGNRWTTELMERLSHVLGVAGGDELQSTMTGTAALRLCFEAAVGGPEAARGKVAVLPAFTFAATAEALVQIGFRLRFADIDPHTWTLDPTSLERALEKNDVSLVVPVDALGAPADHARIAQVAARFGVPVVADSAAALGSSYRGAPIAGLQWAHAYSLSFAKTLTAGGIGGLALAPRGSLGSGPSQWTRSSMMSEIHAVAALDQVEALPALVRRRDALAARYDALLAGRSGVSRQSVRTGDGHSWVHYVLALPDAGSRDAVARGLERDGVQTKRYYAPVLTDPEWGHRFDSGYGPAESVNLTVTESLSDRVLALPMSSEFTAEQSSRSVAALERALDRLTPVADLPEMELA